MTGSGVAIAWIAVPAEEHVHRRRRDDAAADAEQAREHPGDEPDDDAERRLRGRSRESLDGALEDLTLALVRGRLDAAASGEPAHVLHLLVVVGDVAAGRPHEEEVHELADAHALPDVEVADVAEAVLDRGLQAGLLADLAERPRPRASRRARSRPSAAPRRGRRAGCAGRRARPGSARACAGRRPRPPRPRACVSIRRARGALPYTGAPCSTGSSISSVRTSKRPGATSIVGGGHVPGELGRRRVSSCPGETLVIIGGFYARVGDLWLPLPDGRRSSSWSRSRGTTSAIWIGRRYGRGFLERHGRKVFVTPERLETAERYYEEHGGKTVFLGRFIPVVRSVGFIVAGVAQMEWRRFIVYDVAGATIWGVGHTLLGYALGASYERWEKYLTPIGLGLLVVLLLLIGGSKLLAARRKVKEDLEEIEEQLELEHELEHDREPSEDQG